MKKSILILLTAITFASCVTGSKIPTVSGVENLKREDYTIQPEQTTTVQTHRLWVLFIPIVRIGPKTESGRDTKAFDKMVRNSKADGVIAAKYLHKKWCVPLILVNYSHKSVTLTGKPFAIKTDSLKK